MQSRRARRGAALPINGALYSSGELGTWPLKLAEIPTIIPQKDGEFIKSHVSVQLYRVPVLEGLVFACALPKNHSFQNGHPIFSRGNSPVYKSKCGPVSERVRSIFGCPKMPKCTRHPWPTDFGRRTDDDEGRGGFRKT